MGKFIISKRNNGEFQFNLKASNGQSILTSEGYSSRSGCESGIVSVKKNSQIEARFERKTSTNGKPYFNLKASNGQVIGNSERYESESSREAGISSVMKNAADAVTEDWTLEPG